MRCSKSDGYFFHYSVSAAGHQPGMMACQRRYEEAKFDVSRTPGNGGERDPWVNDRVLVEQHIPEKKAVPPRFLCVLLH